MNKYLAECIGTFILVFFGCGTAIVSGGNLVATSLAFGLSIIAAAYSIGNISGAHLNPAVSLGFYMTKRLSQADFVGYVVAQVAGSVIAALILKILSATVDGDQDYLLDSFDALGSNGFGEFSGCEMNFIGALIVEIITTLIFVLVILQVTAKAEHANIAGIVIGLTLTLIHLTTINLTGTSVNPARSLGPALFAGFDHLKQVWVFIVGPLAGAALAALVYPILFTNKTTK